MNTEGLKKGLQSMLENKEHGIGTMKKDHGDLKEGISGTITAYLPEMEKFAIEFNDDTWITFSMTEEEFIELVEVNK
ncbi:hypothetical protein COB55_05590 [Candidatus Wolfebacteria bacterium]|nr:MAG: hypothetical protein COB55_05590 [Candidatus Wolfebacteria bacterium]